jgi:hypothetical protein
MKTAQDEPATSDKFAKRCATLPFPSGMAFRAAVESFAAHTIERAAASHAYLT